MPRVPIKQDKESMLKPKLIDDAITRIEKTCDRLEALLETLKGIEDDAKNPPTPLRVSFMEVYDSITPRCDEAAARINVAIDQIEYTLLEN